MKECKLCGASARMYWNWIKRACAETVIEGPLHELPGRKALHESAMPFVPTHRGEDRADGVVVRAVYEGEGDRGLSRGGGEPRR
ncbi:hypothetical protein Scep_026358 [Stephania cephalantha]|uniref:Uncharacterized protein n=1 Tax=Stephania cephalantha TaxID=152367 RepID=A0AAP0HQA9_9MAGN